MTPQSAGIARINRAFDESPDRYSCAFNIRPALQDIREIVFADVGRPTPDNPCPALRSCHAYSAVIDRLLGRAYRFVSRYVGAGDDPRDLPLAVIATGGYGRREMSPHSDVDLLVVYRGVAPVERSVATIEALLPFLSDAGIPLAHAVRSIDEVKASLGGDLVTATATLEGRFLTGDAEVFRELQRAGSEPYLKRHGADYVNRRIAESQQRHDFFGSSPSVKEPNVKESAGGLRDIHALLWIDRAARSVYDLSDRPMFPWDGRDGKERLAEVVDAYDYLLSLRVHAHLDAGRKNDRLDLATWERLASRIGCDQSGGLLGVEALMRGYHRRARFVVEALERTLDEVEGLRVRSRPSYRPTRRSTNGAFARTGDQFFASRDDIFDQDPVRLMEGFLLAQRQRVKPSHRLVVQARRDAPLLAEKLRADPRSRTVFRAVFEGQGNVAECLRDMHRAGVLAAWLPEFGDVVGLVRFEPYHEYTVDEHSLRAVEMIDQLERGEGDSFRREVLRSVLRIDLLKLSLLLHDIGKSRGHSHVEKGLSLLAAISDRLGLSAEEARTVAFLMEHYLLMSHTSQRSEFNDEAVLDAFVTKVGTKERLQLLYLLTYADVSATSRGALTRWVDHLLTSLFKVAMDRIARGESAMAEPAGLEASVRALASREGIDGESAVDHLLAMDAGYGLIVEPAEVLRHLELGSRVCDGDPVTVDVESGSDFTKIWLSAKDRPGLLADMCLTISRGGHRIVAADAHTRTDGVVFDRFLVEPAEALGADALARQIGDVIKGLDGDPQSDAEAASAPPSLTGSDDVFSRDRVKVHVDPERLRDAVAVEVDAHDRPGLLHDLARCFARRQLDIRFARVVTREGRAEDIFHVSGAGVESFGATDVEALEVHLVLAARGSTQSGVHEEGQEEGTGKPV